ncbi:RNA polymerase sigma-70 factor [Mucilaginibacter sp. HMF7410]|uniref:RNA polymerase sigma-70 factor n=2 Tax=Mucilaginibacter arboris TaxID=2682090 RepID=A0A7K1ST55_9SPHI|nr:RNA polymerase sigma-70 factor [Mucilaginibacter arboris]
MENRPYKDLPEQVLFALFQQSNENAFSEIYFRYSGALYKHALKMLKDRDEAKDIIQDIFASFWLKRESLILTTSLASYLYTSVRNKVLDVFSHEKVAARYQQSLQAFIDQGEFITDDWLREKELTAIIDQQIAELPPKMRAVFELSRKTQLSYREISEELDICENTVRKHITKAIKKLKVKLDTVVIIALTVVEIIQLIRIK